MELRTLQSSTITTSLPSSSSSRCIWTGKPFHHGQTLSFSHPFSNQQQPRNARKRTRLHHIRAKVSGTSKIRSEAVDTVPPKSNKDENLVFVAGATGRVGSRTVRELLKLGFRVRAGVRSAQRAESLVKSVQQMKPDDRSEGKSTPYTERLEIAECDLEKRNQIELALSDASTVICCIGASEKEVFDVTGPYRIDYLAAKNLIDAATLAKVNHFILLTSLGTNKIGFPAAILNLFWGVLCWKRKAEEALITSGLPYTIVRPGGMERPTDAYKETHNITLSKEDTLFGGQVSNLQVAELLAFMAKNRKVSFCKVVEVIAETTVPLTPMEKLLSRIPSQRTEIDEKKGSDAAGFLDPASGSTKIEVQITSRLEKPTQPKAITSGPLSPYIVYDDLKPPASPSPTPPDGKNEGADTIAAAPRPSIIDAQASTNGSTYVIVDKGSTPEKSQTRPLSPFTVYEDLKPPTSPSPVASGPRESNFTNQKPINEISSSTGSNDAGNEAHIISTGAAQIDPLPDVPFYSLQPYKFAKKQISKTQITILIN